MFCKQKNVYMLCTYIYDGMAEEAVVVCVCVCGSRGQTSLP